MGTSRPDWRSSVGSGSPAQGPAKSAPVGAVRPGSQPAGAVPYSNHAGSRWRRAAPNALWSADRHWNEPRLNSVPVMARMLQFIAPMRRSVLKPTVMPNPTGAPAADGFDERSG